MTFLETCKQTNRRPSEAAGISCDYCAWCFDQALIARAGARRVREQDEAEQSPEAHSSKHADRMRDHKQKLGMK